MVEPLHVPTPAPPAVLSPANITGSPAITIATALAALAQYMAAQGPTLPHDTSGWVSFGIGAAMTILGALARGPQRSATVPLVLVALGALAGQAYAATAYDGVRPERPVLQSLGSGNIVCPAHPTLYVAAIAYSTNKRAEDEQPQFVGVCAYCATRNIFEDPACRSHWFSMGEIMTWFPDRRWQVGVGGPCEPGTSADVTISVVGGTRFATSTTGGCNSGPEMPQPAAVK